MREDTQKWSPQRLRNMISNGAEESINLDFKAAPALSDEKKKEICKDVSAFANSDGGAIIYGIEEAEFKASNFSFIDGSVWTKERLEQIIADGIQRKIEGIIIHPIRFDGDIKKSVYVVEIPASDLSPHMTKDNKFYKRYNFMSVVMEEYEVRNSYNKKQNVKLDLGDIQVKKSDVDWIRMTNNDEWYNITINLFNSSKVPAKDYRIKVYLPVDTELEFDPKLVNHTSELLGDAVSNLNTPTIFPREELSIISFSIGLRPGLEYDKILLHCYIMTGFESTDIVYDIAKSVSKAKGQQN